MLRRFESAGIVLKIIVLGVNDLKAADIADSSVVKTLVENGVVDRTFRAYKLK